MTTSTKKASTSAAMAAGRTRPAKTPTDRPRKRASTPVDDIPMPELGVLDLRSDEMDTEPDLVEVFRLDGRPYYVDRNVGAGVALRMLKALRHQGQESAVAAMLEEMLGEEAFDDLANFRGIKAKHLAQVLLQIQRAILGDENSGPKA